MARGIEKLHPELQEIAAKFLTECKKQGLPVLITETWRTKAEQDSLYSQGRTAPGKVVTNCKYPDSPHCWGVAFDICKNLKGSEYDDRDGFFQKAGAVGKKLGLFWGGNFKSFTDKPHFELAKYLPSNSVNTLQGKFGTPENFKKVWGDDEVVTKTKIVLNGVTKEVEVIVKNDTNYIKLRDLADSRISVDYDSKLNLPVVVVK